MRTTVLPPTVVDDATGAVGTVGVAVGVVEPEGAPEPLGVAVALGVIGTITPGQR
jgi:hypothetical protein